ncbi:MAG: YlbF family regulator [Bacilli bacterium]|nr:YlbF family regulator [Bacilli bacterium]
MNETIIKATYALKSDLNNDERIILLNELENKLNSNEEVMALSYAKDVAADKYNEMVRLFKDGSEEASLALKQLSIAKANLDNHPLVREYVKAYQKVRELYNEINGILYSSFNPSLCPHKENK